MTLDINVNILWRRSVESQTGGLAGWPPGAHRTAAAAGQASHDLFKLKLIFIT